MIRVIQITDSHLYGEKEGKLLGMNTEDSFQAIFNLVKKEQLKPDLVLVTGDISQDGSQASYDRMSQAMAYFEVPVFWLPGNHDHLSLMRHTFGAASVSPCLTDIGDWRIILLNSQIEQEVPGRLSESELDFLACTLLASQHKRILICLHHHPVLLSCHWLDTVALLNPDPFFKIIDQYDNIHAIVWGHVHQAFESARKNVLLFSTPSTCVQFKPKSDDFALDKVAPGYRWFDLFNDGSLRSGVSRVKNFKLTVDHSAKGY